jgi:DNA polymerase
MTQSKTEELKKIKDEILSLTASPLYAYRTENSYYPVIGEGDHDAAIMFIGEAPGLNEAKTARPFVGAAGKFLGELLLSVGIKREDVYITNIVKDRPPENRDPTPQEIEIYAPFLDRQINTIQPKVLATLGRFSMAYIMQKYGLEDYKKGISKIHGEQFSAKTPYGEIKIIPLYHPAVALYNGGARVTLQKDFEILKVMK